jgi:acetyl esterase/lipase
MTAVRVLLRAIAKPRLGRATYATLRAGDRHDPPRRLARRHRTREVAVGDARAVWVDRERSAHGVLVYLHGGSYVSGPIAEQWTYLARLCDATGMAGLLVDYRLAPRHTFPVALEDALAIAAHLDSESVGPWFLVGESAGGGLALATAYRLRDGGRPLPRALVLSSPWLDVTLTGPHARATERRDPSLSRDVLAELGRVYAAHHDPRDPHISPLFGDPAQLPPALIHVGTSEMLLGDIRTWGSRCAEAGTACRIVEVPGGFHGFTIVLAVPEARAALAEQAAFIRRHA